MQKETYQLFSKYIAIIPSVSVFVCFLFSCFSFLLVMVLHRSPGKSHPGECPSHPLPHPSIQDFPKMWIDH